MRIKKIRKIKKITNSQLEQKSLASSVKKQKYDRKKHLKATPKNELTSLMKLLQYTVSKLKGKITLKTLAEYEDKERIIRAKQQLRVFFLNGIRKNIFNFVVKSSGTVPTNPSYMVKVQFKDLLEFKKQGLNHRQALRKSTLGLECSCDDFRYRFRYWVTKMEALPDGAIKEMRFTKITNPNTEHKFVCKHIILVTNSLDKPSFRDSIFKRFYDKIDLPQQVRVTKQDKSKTISMSKRVKK